MNPSQAAPAISELLESGEDQLLAELGIRSSAISQDPAVAGSFAPHATFDGDVMGAMDTMRDLGRRLLKRWNREAYKLLCGDDPDDQKARDELRNAVSMGDVAFGATLAGLLVSTFGIAPAIAAVIATLLVKRFLKPTYQEVCAVWSAKL